MYKTRLFNCLLKYKFKAYTIFIYVYVLNYDKIILIVLV
ncbi:hypothetical protein H04402_01227 [Clostridium botulinum H04402 065]|nr:hypothetical protein H04402_01227 [Clostridium botulinum H04402 065]